MFYLITVFEDHPSMLVHKEANFDLMFSIVKVFDSFQLKLQVEIGTSLYSYRIGIFKMSQSLPSTDFSSSPVP